MIDTSNNLSAAFQVPQTSPRAASTTSLHGFKLDNEQPTDGKPKDELRELTEMVVSTAFIAPMFEQLRNDPLASNLIHGGRGEKVFQQQLDQVYADRMARTTSFGLADALYRQFSNPAVGETLNTDA